MGVLPVLLPFSRASTSGNLPTDRGADPSKCLFTLTKVTALRSALARMMVANRDMDRDVEDPTSRKFPSAQVE